jgi:hypothetical protein
MNRGQLGKRLDTEGGNDATKAGEGCSYLSECG